MTGKVTVNDLLILKSSAKIQGDISTNNLVIESGASFNGACAMGTEESVDDEPIEDDEK